MNEIVAFVRKATDPDFIPKKPYDVVVFVGFPFSLEGEQVNNYLDLLNFLDKALLSDYSLSDSSKRQFLGAGWNKKYSKRYFTPIISDLVIGLAKQVKEGKLSLSEVYIESENSLIRLESEYDEFSRHQVVKVPLDGIEIPKGLLKNDKLTIGNVSLTRGNERESLFIRQSFHGSAEESSTSFETGVYAEYTTPVNMPAEPLRAQEHALSETQRALDLVLYSIPLLYTSHPSAADRSKEIALASGKKEGAQLSSPYTVQVGLKGDISTDHLIIHIKSIENDNQMLAGVDKPSGKFVLSRENIKQMKSIGVFEVSKILQKTHQKGKDPAPFEDSILRAIHWFANSVVFGNSVQTENELLSLFACLEVIFSRRSSHRNAIANGVAAVISNLNDLGMCKLDKQKLAELEKFITDNYDKRSEISHGEWNIIAHSDLIQLRKCTQKIIQWAIMRRTVFQNNEELAEWVHCRRLDCSKWSKL